MTPTQRDQWHIPERSPACQPQVFPFPLGNNGSLLPLPLFSVEGTFQLPLDLKVT